jgi:X-Pro dipeptidyl-peptidase
MKPGRLGRRAVAAAAALVVAVVAPTALGAGSETGPVVMGGVTQPVFGYADAIRERVWVESTFDSDLDGVNDLSPSTSCAREPPRPTGSRCR